MDTSWCPVCDRLIPPHRLQVPAEQPAAAQVPIVVQATIDDDSTTTTTTTTLTKPSKSKASISSTTRTKNNTSAKAKRLASPTKLASREKVPSALQQTKPTTSASTSDVAPTKPATSTKPPKTRTILTQDPSLYCSEECRLEDLHKSSLALFASPSSYSSFTGGSYLSSLNGHHRHHQKSPPTSPLFVSGSESDDIPGGAPEEEEFDPDRANLDYFTSLRRGEPFYLSPSNYSRNASRRGSVAPLTTASTSGLARTTTTSSTDSIGSTWEWTSAEDEKKARARSRSKSKDRAKARTSHSSSDRPRSSAVQTMTPLSRTTSHTPSESHSRQHHHSHSRHHSSQQHHSQQPRYLPRASIGYLGTSAPIHRTMPASAADLYASAYPLAFERSQSSNSIPQVLQQRSSSSHHHHHHHHHSRRESRDRADKHHRSQSRSRERAHVVSGLSASAPRVSLLTSTRKSRRGSRSGSPKSPIIATTTFSEEIEPQFDGPLLESDSEEQQQGLDAPFAPRAFLSTSPPSNGKSKGNKSHMILDEKEAMKKNATRGLLLHVALPMSTSNPPPPMISHVGASGSISSTTSSKSHADIPRGIGWELLPSMSGMSGGMGSKSSKVALSEYVPTYPLEVIPLKPGEKRKRLFYFGH